MGELDDHARRLLDLYREKVAPLLEQHGLATRQAVANAADVLGRVLERPSHVQVAFLGDAQVGKSSLVNALLGDRLLPTGGIGPLTAKETCVEWSAEPSAEVTYHDVEAFDQLARKVFSYLLRRGELRADARTSAEPIDDVQLDLDLVSERDAEADAPPEETKKSSELYDYLVDQARTLLTKDNPDVTEAPRRGVLLDGLWAVVGREPTKAADAGALAPFRGRIAEIRALLAQGQDRLSRAGQSDREFRLALRQRAAGWMSPLVKKLVLRLDHELLRGLSLWDLPGVGVVGDPAAHMAKRFVEHHADVVVIVTRNTALTHTLDKVLEESGVVTKLLFGGRDGVPPIRVVVAVTHLDNVTRDNYSRLAQDAASVGDLPPDPDVLFRDDAEKMKSFTREQVLNRLLASEAFANMAAEKRQRREQVVRELCRTMSIVPVVSPDFLNLQQPQTQRLAFLTDLATTGVPEVQRSLRTVVSQVQDARNHDLREARDSLHELVLQHVELINRAYAEGGGGASTESERFRDALQERAAALTQRMRLNREPCLVRLSELIPRDIEHLCYEAERRAEAHLRALTKKAKALYWPSLNAALAKDGVYGKRDLDYPSSLTQTMVDCVAEQWEPQVIDGVRRLMKELTDHELGLVDELCAAAVELDPKLAMEAGPEVEGQKRILRQDARTCVSWTKERLEELREQVRTELEGVIRPPIAEACEAARARGANRGAGAKLRIIETFEAGSQEAIVSARGTASGLLRRIYRGLLEELQGTYLAAGHDPIQAMHGALTRQRLEYAERSDAARRRQVLAELEAVRAALGPLAGGAREGA